MIGQQYIGELAIQRRERQSPIARYRLKEDRDGSRRERLTDVGRENDGKLQGFAICREFERRRKTLRPGLGGRRSKFEVRPRSLAIPAGGTAADGGLKNFESDRERVRANLAPLARLPARAEVLDVDVIPDEQSGLDDTRSALNLPGQPRRIPFGGQHPAGSVQRARFLHRLPATGLGEELFGK